MTDTASTIDVSQRVDAALAALTLAEKVQLLTGRDFWSTHPIDHIGLRSMVLSDGPSGVRGAAWDERDPSLNLPSATALASAWDLDIARRYGAAAAVEARRKGVDVVLGPTINLHRSPLGGRHFEAFSEDPILTGELAAAYVTGMQDNGVGATPKHFLANDFETDRFTVDVHVDERPLRELYLLAFERAVTEARAWLVMSSYNKINGVTATENDLLDTPLKREWGFDGVVVSDWTAVRSLASAAAAQDLVMPGPDGPWGELLLAAVQDGRIAEAAIDDKIRRILMLAGRVGALDGFVPAALAWVEDGQAFARTAAIEGTVLLENRGELPWDPATLRSVAVIGDNARNARTQGGGSATVLPASTVSPLDGLRAALPEAAVTYSVGALNQVGLTELPIASLTNPVTGEPGAHVRFLGAQGRELFTEDRRATNLVWFGGDAPIRDSLTVELSTRFTPAEDGALQLGFAVVGHGRLFLDGQEVLDEILTPVGDDLGAAFLMPPSATVSVQLTAGEPIDLRFELDLEDTPEFLLGALAFQVGTEAAAGNGDELIADAVRAAREADVALVVVGTNAKVESEGYDRSSLALPGRQDDLVRAVAAANPRTVVVVNAGSPVLLPWRDEVAGVLVGFFGGQEFGAALADVLLGVAEPGGRLTTTWPARQEDVPVIDVTPSDGVVRYDEGIHIGYRAWLRAGRTPAYWFGAGSGYTEIALIDAIGPAVEVAAGEHVSLEVDVENRGARTGKQIVQVYAEKGDSVVERPVRWLVGFAVVRVEAGKTMRVAVDVPTRLLAYWDGGWRFESGQYLLRIGTSAVELPIDVTITLTDA